MSLINKFSVTYNLEQKKRRRGSNSTRTYIEKKAHRTDILSHDVAEALIKLGFDIEILMMLLKIHPYSTVDEALNLLSRDPDTHKLNHHYYQPKPKLNSLCAICQGKPDEHIDYDIIGKVPLPNNINDENIKDINISTSVEDVDLSEYGYDDNANGVALVFQPNGILPCTSKIYIKDDYVSNKFNLSGNIYLGFIKSSVDDEEELSSIESDTNEDIEVEDSDVEDDEIEYVKENDMIVIEDSIIEYENGYVTITMTHNSSYILSDSLPVIKTNVEDIPDNEDALTLPSPEANNSTTDTNIIIDEVKIVPANVELQETEIDEVVKKETVITNNIKIKDNIKEEVVSKTDKNNKKSYSFIKFRMVVENFFSFINQKMHNLIVILLSIFK